MMMLAMPCGPDSRRFLQAACAQNGKRALHPARAGKATVRQKSMIADIHAEPTKDVASERRKQDSGPTEEPGEARSEGDEMDKNNWRGISPFDEPCAARSHRSRTSGSINHSVVARGPSQSQT